MANFKLYMKKYFAVIFLILIVFGLAVSVQTANGNYPTIIEDYPRLPACQDNEECRPGEAGFGLPEFIKYIFQFSLGIVGVIGLVALIMAAFGYVMSAGNPQKAADAKDQIVSALLGLLLLLGSVVLLNLINPDLLKLKITDESVTVTIPGDDDEEQCRPINVAWEKSTISAGESTYLIFTLNEYCSGQESTAEIYVDDQQSFLRQDRPTGTGCEAGAATGWDPYCGIYYTGIRRAGHNDEGLILLKYEYEFRGQCRDKWNISECPNIAIPSLCPDGPKYTGTICNFKIDESERFYVQGNGKMHDGTTFSVPMCSITVEDNK